jgi:hypothetical protein
MPLHIPKIIHQIWIGPKSRPQQWMHTWKALHPDWEYRLWTEENLPPLVNQKQFDAMRHYSGKADILRYELLYRHGGIYMDADSECLRPLPDAFLRPHFLAFYENEELRPGLICNCAFGSEPNHPILKKMIEVIGKIEDVNKEPPWVNVGPLLFTKVIEAHKSEAVILPSYRISPTHFEGNSYSGRGRVYAKQHWSTTSESREWVDAISDSAFATHEQRKEQQREHQNISKKALEALIGLIKELHVHTILDAPCGAFRWHGKAKLDVEEYVGIDFSQNVVEKNRKQHGTTSKQFLCMDYVQHALPQADLVLCIDGFSQLSNEEIYTALHNFVKCGARYLLASNTAGRDLMAPPLNLPQPLKAIQDGNRVLALWQLNH